MASTPVRTSLRARLLIPLLTVCGGAAIIVAIGSYWLGTRWAMNQVHQRYLGLRNTLQSPRFPLNEPVSLLVSELSQIEIVSLDSDGEAYPSTIALTAAEQSTIASLETSPRPIVVQLAGSEYLAYRFMHRPSGFPDQAHPVVILFDKQVVDRARQQYAAMPLVTGLSSILILGVLMHTLSEFLINRIARLQTRVAEVAGGDFESTLEDRHQDELGQLATEIDAMVEQLRQLWETVNRQQGEKLLHQLASGMAHQLRNAVTGARMAIELHERHCDAGRKQDLSVAITQLERVESYIQRILSVGSNPSQGNRMPVQTCLEDLQTSLASMAEHVGVSLTWDLNPAPSQAIIGDGSAFTSAISNLIINAIQAGDSVLVHATYSDDGFIDVEVKDDGPGIDDTLTSTLFDPFVTSKPEGLGLGLPVVRRAAEELGGSVSWRRDSGQTVFTFRAAIEENHESS